MRLAPAMALALVLAAAPAPAAAETIGRSAVTAGPVLAGARVLWADAPSGRPRVLSGGGVIATWPAATKVDTGRTVAALAGRVLAQGRFAGFDPAPDRAVWAVGRPGGFQRIVLERL